MLNFKNYCLVLIFILNSYFIYAEEVDIENIQSSQGIRLTCASSTTGDLSLYIYGETGKRQVTLILDNKNYIINDTEISYTKSIYDGGGSEPHYPLVKTKKIYFNKGKPLSGLTINEEDIKDSEETLELIKEALEEAHEKGNCLNWKL